MKAKILVADDDEFIRELLVEAISAKGHEVETASDGLLALKTMRSTDKDSRFDIVVTDIDMPRMNGIILSQHIAEEFPNTSIIAITGYGNKGTIIELLRCGVCEYLDKPFTPSELVSRIEAILGNLKEAGQHREITEMRDEVNDLVSSEVQQHKKKILEWLRGGVQHRFNQPLTVLLGNLSILDQMVAPNRIEHADPEELSTVINDIRNAGYCLKDLVNLMSNMQEFTTEEYVGNDRIMKLSPDE